MHAPILSHHPSGIFARQGNGADPHDQPLVRRCFTGEDCVHDDFDASVVSAETFRAAVAQFATRWKALRPDLAGIAGEQARAVARDVLIPAICELSRLFDALVRADGHNEAVSIANEQLRPLLMDGSLYAMTLHPPFGYKGDFQVIDRITDNTLAGDGASQVLDASYQAALGAKVVRSRRVFLTEYLADVVTHAQPPVRLLSLGCGSAPELAALLDSVSPSVAIEVFLLDIEERALAAARRRLEARRHPHLTVHPVTLDIRSVLRRRLEIPSASLNLVYSSGLFDYLSDDIAIAVLGRLATYLRPEGRLLVGNLDQHPGMAMMELFADWPLVYRTADDLDAIARAADLRPTCCLTEAHAVNLFLEAAA